MINQQSRRARVDVAELRQKITKLVAENAIAMVQRAIDSVNEEGQYQAIKYLFEMVGIYPTVSGSDEQHEDTLAELLLRQLGVKTSEGEILNAEGGADDPVK